MDIPHVIYLTMNWRSIYHMTYTQRNSCTIQVRGTVRTYTTATAYYPAN